MLSIRRIHSHFNNIIKILIVSDFVVWSAANMIIVIFPVFVVDQIEGGTIEAAGLSSMIYLLVSAINTIPIGIMMDKIKGYVDERNFLFWSTLLRGILIFLFSSINKVWQLYTIQFLLGITRAAMLPSWRLLFAKYADKNKEGFEWSAYDAITTIGMGIAAYMGSLIVGQSNYDLVFQLAGFLTVLGAFLLVFLRLFIKK